MESYGFIKKPDKRQFFIADRKIAVYASATADRPIVYLNTFADESDDVYEELQRSRCPDFTLVSVGRINWDEDMSPWAIPPISEKDAPCTGGADKFIRLTLEEIIPQAEQNIQGVSWRGIVGYSLAGLFAIYALYRTDIFSRAGSVSGSLWFPKFREYVFENEMKAAPDRLYFSLGDKECLTANPYLKTVRENTEAIAAYYRDKGVPATFELNAGNHFQNAAARTAKGISRLLSNEHK